MSESETVKSQLDLAISLFDDLSQGILRIEEKADGLEAHLNSIKGIDAKSEVVESISTDATELRNLIITLRQQLEKSITTDLDPLTSTLKFLQVEIPELTSRVSELSTGLTALNSQTIPSMKETVNSVLANVSPMKANTDEAGSFAKNFHEPLMKMLGKRPDFQIVEGENILMNMASAIFELTGRDAVGKLPPKGEEKLKSFLATNTAMMEHYFKKHYLDEQGKARSRGAMIFEQGLDYMTTNLWHKFFDAIILFLLWILLINPAQKSLQMVQDASDKQYTEFADRIDKKMKPLLDQLSEKAVVQAPSRVPSRVPKKSE